MCTFFYFFCTARQTWTALTMQRLDPFVTHTANLCSETQTRCIRNAYLMLGGGGVDDGKAVWVGDGREECLGVPLLLCWRGFGFLLHGVLLCILSSPPSLTISLHFPSPFSAFIFPQVSVFHPSLLVLLHTVIFFPLSSFNKLTKKKSVAKTTGSVLQIRKKGYRIEEWCG